MGDEKSRTPMDRQLNILDVYRALKERKRIFFGTLITFVLLALLHGLFSNRIYESHATILAPRESGGGGLASTLIASGVIPASPSIMPPSLAANRDLFINVLKSRTMADEVVTRFDLQKRYRERYQSDAIEELQKSTSISLSKQGVISVRVEETDPQLAAEIANFYTQNLDRMLARFKTTEAGKQRSFIETRLSDTEKELRRAEGALRTFQETHRAISLQEQARLSVEEGAKLNGQIIAAEVQLAALRSYASEENPEVILLRRQIEEWKRHLAGMQFGESSSSSSRGADLEGSLKGMQVPFAEFPELSQELARLMRDLKIQETVYTLLTQQFEEAKIAEARDTPTVQVLDKAVPAERPIRPRWVINLALATVSGFLLGLLLVYFPHYLAGLKLQKSHPPVISGNGKGGSEVHPEQEERESPSHHGSGGRKRSRVIS